MNSLIYIFSIEDEKMILIMILAMFNKDKIIIVMTFYISLTNDFEKWYKSTKINYFHWISSMIQRAMIIVIIFDIKISKKFQIYIWNLFRENKLSSIYFDEVYMLRMKRYFRQKFELFRWLYLFMLWIFFIMIFFSSMKCRFEEKLMLTNSISTYIQMIINKMNARYSMIKMIKKKIEKRMIKIMNEIIKNL